MSSPLSRYAACEAALEESFRPVVDKRDRVLAPPPVPAPYLVGAPELPAALLTATRSKGRLLKPVEQKLTAAIYSLAADLQFRREHYQDVHGVEIVPEDGHRLDHFDLV